MMNFKKTLIASTLLGVSMVVTPGLMTNAFATSDTSTEEVSLKDVRQEMSEVSEMLTHYTVQQRDEALQETQKAITNVDKRIDQMEKNIQAKWDEMSESARTKATDAMNAIKEKRAELGKRYSELESGTDDAWDDLMKGFSNAWDELVVSWEESMGMSKTE